MRNMDLDYNASATEKYRFEVRLEGEEFDYSRVFTRGRKLMLERIDPRRVPEWRHGVTGHGRRFTEAVEGLEEITVQVVDGFTRDVHTFVVRDFGFFYPTPDKGELPLQELRGLIRIQSFVRHYELEKQEGLDAVTP